MTSAPDFNHEQNEYNQEQNEYNQEQNDFNQEQNEFNQEQIEYNQEQNDGVNFGSSLLKTFGESEIKIPELMSSKKIEMVSYLLSIIALLFV